MPNVLLLCADALRADRCFGENRTAVTPHMDAMRQEGAALRTTCAVNTFTAPCVSSLLTGLYPFHHGVRTQLVAKISSEVQTLAERLDAMGINAYADVTGPVGPARGHDRGFKEFRSRVALDDHLWSDWWDTFIERFTDGSLKEPWFYYVHVWDTHGPHVVPPKYRHVRYGETSYDRAVSALDEKLGEILRRNENNVVILTADHGTMVPRRGLNVWYSRIRSTRLVCRIRRLLPARERVCRAIVRARHALGRAVDKAIGRQPASGGTGEGAFQLVHGVNVYEGSVRIPWIMRGPGVPRGVEMPNVVSQVDQAPTILELLCGAGNADAGRGMDGRSVLRFLRGEPWPERPIYMESTHTHIRPTKNQWAQAVRTQRHKYITAPWDPKTPDELYDLDADPEEAVNIAPGHPDVVRQMREHLRGLNDVDDVWGPAETGDALSTEEQAEVEERLRDLGYIE